MAFIAGLGPLLNIVSTGIGIFGTLMQASANAEAANYQAQVAERNRKINEENAVRALHRSVVEQQQQDRITRGLLGEQLAAQAASGISADVGTPVMTRKSAQRLGRLDALNIRQAGEIEAYNFRQVAQDAGLSADFFRRQASNAMLEGFLSGAGTLIGGMQTFVKPASNIFGKVKVPPIKRARYA